MEQIPAELSAATSQSDEAGMPATLTGRDATYNGFVELTLEQLEAEESRKAAQAQLNQAETIETDSYL